MKKGYAVVPSDCGIGMDCGVTGICYADAHGQPEQCPRYVKPLECEACDATDADGNAFCEGCDCCAECCNCTSSDCDCEVCEGRRENNGD